MSLMGQKISGVKVINILEESAQAIEKMVNGAIEELHSNGMTIVDVQTTQDHIVLIFGQEKTRE